MRKFILILVILMGRLGICDDSIAPITLHLPCETKMNCEKLKTIEGAFSEVERLPRMSFTAENVEEAFVSPSGNGEEVITIVLNQNAANEFAQLTEKNIMKPLSVVFRGQVLMAPVIRQRIEGGRLMIENGKDKKINLLEEIPWLKQKASQKKIMETKKADRQMWIYAIISGLVILGAICFGFMGRKSERETL